MKNKDVTINVVNLTKIYDNGIKGIENLSFEIKEGDIFGLLGPNGAGKSTTIGILATLIKPSKGDAYICGYSVVKEKEKVRKHILLVPQETALDITLTVWENLYFYAWLQGVPRNKRRRIIEEVIEIFGLQNKRNSRVITLSEGLKRRVQLARAFLVKRDVIFLDEPTLGLDPISKSKAWKLIKSLSDENGSTVIVATNDMREAEVLCNKIVFLNTKLLAVGGLDELKSLKEYVSMYVKLKSPLDFSFLNTMSGVINYSIKDNDCVNIILKSREFIHETVSSIINRGGRIYDVSVSSPSLEDLFFYFFKGD